MLETRKSGDLPSMRLNGIMPVVATWRASTEGVMLVTTASISPTSQRRLTIDLVAARDVFTFIRI